jgi:hypothetical protein
MMKVVTQGVVQLTVAAAVMMPLAAMLVILRAERLARRLRAFR